MKPKECARCGGWMKPGSVLLNFVYGTTDFGGDFGAAGTTVSEGPGDGTLYPCLKCESCGHTTVSRQILINRPLQRRRKP